MATDPKLVRAHFLAAAELPAVERDAYFSVHCVGDGELRAAVERLLAAHDQPASVLNRPIPGGVEQTAPSVRNEQPGTIIADKYKLLQQIGEGGMGTVWMADQVEPIKRRVAVKLIRVERGNSKTILSRFEAERQAIALMDHPHIAKLLDAGTTDAGQPYFVMDLVKGVPLTDYCDAQKLSIQHRLGLFQQICSAVQHAHQKGVIHRDLKPTNILIESHDGKPVPKVIDFGLAKATSGLQLTDHTLFTAFGSVMGTPLYMAPEQATFNSIDVDTRADIYALGVILYELLTGTTPLTRDAAQKAALDEILKLVREQEAPTPSSRLTSADLSPCVAANRQTEPGKLGRFVKGELDWIVLKALNKERDRRYETASGFAKDIARFLNHEPVQAGPPGAAYRMKKFVRRNRPQVVAAGFVLLAVVAGVAGMTWGLIEAKKQERIAVEARNDAVAARERSDSDRAEAVAIKNFVVKDMLGMTNGWAGSGDPGERGPNVTVRTLLDRASRLVGVKFADRPMVEAGVRAAIGSSWNAIGLQREAIVQWERVLALYRQFHGPDDLRTLDAIKEVASLHAYQLFDSARAEPLAREALNGYERLLGSDAEEAIAAMDTLASILISLGRHEEGIQMKDEVYRRSLRALGPDNITTANVRSWKVFYYAERRDFASAEPLAIEGLARNLRAFGENHPATHIAARALILVYHLSGYPDRAVPLAEEWMIRARRSFGDQAGDTLWMLHDLARVYHKVGRFNEAARLLEEAYAGFCRSAGANSSIVLRIASMLVDCYTRLGRTEDAVAMLEKAGVGVTGDASTLYDAACMYAIISASTARPGEGERYALRAIALLREAVAKGWKNSIHTVSDGDLAALLDRPDFRSLLAEMAKLAPVDYPKALNVLGLKLLEKKRFIAAEIVLRECLALREKAEPDDWAKFNTQSMLGGALLGQQKHADAEPLLLAGYKGMKQREKTIPPSDHVRISEAIERLVKFYDATNKKDDATTWRKELEEAMVSRKKTEKQP